MHGPMFRRGSQTQTKMNIPRARNVGMGRDAIPMPAEPVVSDPNFEWLFRTVCVCVCVCMCACVCVCVVNEFDGINNLLKFKS